MKRKPWRVITGVHPKMRPVKEQVRRKVIDEMHHKIAKTSGTVRNKVDATTLNELLWVIDIRVQDLIYSQIGWPV